MFLARYDGEITQSETMYKINVLLTQQQKSTQSWENQSERHM